MAEHKGVIVCGEVEDKTITRITKELLGGGRQLADSLGEELGALLLGSELGDIGKQVIAFGADKVYIVDHPLLASYHSDAYTTVVTKLCQQLNPAILLLGQTDMGRDLAPRLASKLGGGLSTGCTELDIDPETKLLMQTRPVYGGNANAVYVTRSARPQIATVRPRSMPTLERDDSRQGETITIEAEVDSSVMRYKIVERVKEEAEGIKLEDAEVVVAGGRGIGSKENFNIIQDLAKLLGGAVGATMPPCEDGWVPSSLQIGQTGKVIGPNLYIAVAISGAMQHIATCLDSKNIVAINKDPEASIFKVADYGVVGDYKEVLPAFMEKCRELLSAD
jgi:electron transfer flavoprotein alpha subunit